MTETHAPPTPFDRAVLTASDYKSFFELSLDLLCLAGFDGYFKEINPAWETVTGYTREELTERPFIEFVHPDDREATMAEAAKLATGVTTIYFENRYRCKDGTYKWLGWTSAPAVDSQMLYAVARDITAKRQAEDELRALNSELATASQHKSQFLANMSHELRTPLNAILGFSQLLLDRPDDFSAGEQATFLRHIRDGGEHLLNLINDVLDLSKVEAGQAELRYERFDVGEAVAEVLNTLSTLADAKEIALLSECSQDLQIRADRGKVKQILYNLVANAIKFTPTGGRIVVGASPVPGGVGVAVIDTGIGIAPEDQERIFGEFQQLDQEAGDRQQGTGLGLALTKSFIELHSGRIWVESEPGNGSKFRFFLPDAPEAATVASSAHEDLVLIVDDSPSAANYVAVLLKRAGFRSTTVRYGRAAIAKARELQPVAVVLDLLLPDIDGWEVLKELKSDPSTRDIPVVVVSVVEDQGIGVALGAADYLVKPVESGLLLERITRIAHERGDRKPILVIDDDIAARDYIRGLLEPNGYEVITASGAVDGLQMAQARRPGAIVLDLVMPGMTGFEIAEVLKETEPTRDIPILVLTGKDLSSAERSRLQLHVQELATKGNLSEHSLLDWLVAVTPRSDELSARSDAS